MLQRNLCRLEIQGPRGFMKNNYFQSNRFLSWAATQPTLKSYSGFGEKLLDGLVSRGIIEPVAATHLVGLYYSFTTNFEENNKKWVAGYQRKRQNLVSKLKSPLGVRPKRIKRATEAIPFDSEKLIEWLLKNKEAATTEEALIISNFLIADQIITPSENFSDLLVSGDLYQFEQPSCVIDLLEREPTEIIKSLHRHISTLHKTYLTTFDDIPYKNVFKASDFIDLLRDNGIVETAWDGVLYGQALTKIGILQEITCGFDDYDDCLVIFRPKIGEPDPVIPLILMDMSKKMTVSFIGEIRGTEPPLDKFDSRRLIFFFFLCEILQHTILSLPRSLSSRQLMSLSKARISLATRNLESVSTSPVPPRKSKRKRGHTPPPTTGFGNGSILSKPSRVSIVLGSILQQLEEVGSESEYGSSVNTGDTPDNRDETSDTAERHEENDKEEQSDEDQIGSLLQDSLSVESLEMKLEKKTGIPSPHAARRNQRRQSPREQRRGVRVTADWDIVTGDPPHKHPSPKFIDMVGESYEMMSTHSQESPAAQVKKPARLRSITDTQPQKSNEVKGLSDRQRKKDLSLSPTSPRLQTLFDQSESSENLNTSTPQMSVHKEKDEKIFIKRH